MRLDQESSDEEYLPSRPTDYSQMLNRKDRILQQIKMYEKHQQTKDEPQAITATDLEITADEAFKRR